MVKMMVYDEIMNFMNLFNFSNFYILSHPRNVVQDSPGCSHSWKRKISPGPLMKLFFLQRPRMNQISPRALPAVNRTDLTHEFGEKKIFIQSWPVCDTRIWPRENTKESNTHEPLMIHSWTTHKGGPWDTDSFMYSYIPYEESNLRDSSDSDGFLWIP